MDVANGDPLDLSRILVAVSDDDDPNGSWYYHSINSMVNIPDPEARTTRVTHWADYPGLAIDEEGIYVTANMFAFGGGPNGSRLWIVDKGLGKGGLYDGGVGVSKIYDPMTASGAPADIDITSTTPMRTLQPAHVFGTAPQGVGTWLAAYDGRTDTVNEFVDVIRITNPLGNRRSRGFP